MKFINKIDINYSTGVTFGGVLIIIKGVTTVSEAPGGLTMKPGGKALIAKGQKGSF